NSYSGVFYRRFVLGEWTVAQGLVYDFFDRERDCPEAPEGPFEQWRVSVDYGTANPASFGLWGLMDGIWYRTEEYYYNSRRVGRQKTDAEYAADLRRLVGEREIEEVIVDPSAASFIETVRREGFRVVKADNDVADGIRTTAEALRSGRMVLCKGCGDCLREMELYCWDQHSGKDAPRKENDHAMDEMRYFAMRVAGARGGDFAATWVERRA
ncbi:MAG: PBSX family phage terminase large subunit, partial [Oscillibacter sp.]